MVEEGGEGFYRCSSEDDTCGVPNADPDIGNYEAFVINGIERRTYLHTSVGCKPQIVNHAELDHV